MIDFNSILAESPDCRCQLLRVIICLSHMLYDAQIDPLLLHPTPPAMGASYPDSRECRALFIGVSIWIIQQVYDAEDEALEDVSQAMEALDPEEDPDAKMYRALEDAYLLSEHATGCLANAMEDLQFAY